MLASDNVLSVRNNSRLTLIRVTSVLVDAYTIHSRNHAVPPPSRRCSSFPQRTTCSTKLLQAPLKVSHPLPGCTSTHPFSTLFAAFQKPQWNTPRATGRRPAPLYLGSYQSSSCRRLFGVSTFKLTCNVVASPKRPVSTPYPYTDLLLHHT